MNLILVKMKELAERNLPLSGVRLGLAARSAPDSGRFIGAIFHLINLFSKTLINRSQIALQNRDRINFCGLRGSIIK